MLATWFSLAVAVLPQNGEADPPVGLTVFSADASDAATFVWDEEEALSDLRSCAVARASGAGATGAAPAHRGTVK